MEFHSKDPSRTREFYGQVFGWKFKDLPEMDYTLFQAPSLPHGGVQSESEDFSGVLNYILSDSIEDTTRKIERAGGTILKPKSEIPNMGWYAVFRDPTGVVQALYQDRGAPQPRRRASGGASAKRGGKSRTSKIRRRRR